MRVRHPSVHIGHRPLVALGVAGLLAVAGIVTVAQTAQAAVPFPIESLDGSGNNVANPTWGQAGRPYARVAPAAYADGIGTPVDRTERPVRQQPHLQRRQPERVLRAPGHPVGLDVGPVPRPHLRPARQRPDRRRPRRTSRSTPSDPLETFTNNLGVIPFNRSAATPGTGTSTANPRQQTNTTSTYIDAFAVYGGTNARLDWLRDGPVDGNPTNNSATLLLPGGYLPRRDARGNAATAPAMDVDGRLLANPQRRAVAGDVRANENIALTATHTLFAREHNRIVALLPNTLSEEDKFQIARRVVIAEQQYITYQEFLPAMGVALPGVHRLQAERQRRPCPTSSPPSATARTARSTASSSSRPTRAATPRPTSTPSRRRASRSTVDGDRRRDRGPAGRGVLQPRPAAAPAARPDAAGARRRVAVQQRRADRQPAPQRRCSRFRCSGNPECLDGPTHAGVLQRRDRPGRDRHPARPRPRHRAPTTSSARPTGCAPKTSFTAITGEATDQFPAGTGVDNPEQPRRRCRWPTSTATPSTSRPGAVPTPPPARCGAPPWPPACGHLRQREQRRRVRRHDRRAARARHRVRRAAAGHLDPRSSRRCATATGSSSATTRA